MIRSFRETDIEAVMSIWLNANIEAHAFIDSEYWKGNFQAVKMMIPQAEVYVSERNHEIDGFIGIIGDYIAGIFVDKSVRTKGIGSNLMEFAKQNREKLDLKVYKKNESAVNFYIHRGFQIKAEDIDMQTSEIEYTMVWEKRGVN